MVLPSIPLLLVIRWSIYLTQHRRDPLLICLGKWKAAISSPRRTKAFEPWQSCVRLAPDLHLYVAGKARDKHCKQLRIPAVDIYADTLGELELLREHVARHLALPCLRLIRQFQDFFTDSLSTFKDWVSRPYNITTLKSRQEQEDN